VCPQARSARPTEPCPPPAFKPADPAPLSARQLQALAAATIRELLWGLRAVSKEVTGWRAHAARIPDAPTRRDALSALARKRANIDGAGLFWTLPRTRDLNLLRLLATYQIMWDFLDCASERGASAGQANGRHLHRALADALDPGRAITDYYRHHPWRNDSGYLRALVESCREYCTLLPSHRHVRPLLVREAFRANVQAINHDLDPARRDASLREWCAQEFPAGHEASWFELTGAAGAGLSIYALFAQATESTCTRTHITRAYNAYFPWASAVATMLDSYVDQVEDTKHGDHVYVAHYPTPELAVEGMVRLVRCTLSKTRFLPRGERHTVIAACMIAMYLSKNSAHSETTREGTRRLVRAGGSLTRLLLPILALWRTAYNQRSA
jgi:tetraprenyl-beta-curcumene synthase